MNSNPPREEKSNEAPALNRIRNTQILTLLGAVLLFIGVIVPLVRPELDPNNSLYGLCFWAALVVTVSSVGSVVLVMVHKLLWLWFPGIAALIGVIAGIWYIYDYYHVLGYVWGYFTYGTAFLIAGAAFVIAGAAITPKRKK